MKEHLYILAKFFMDEFREDAAGVAQWLEANGVDTEAFIKQLADYFTKEVES